MATCKPFRTLVHGDQVETEHGIYMGQNR